MPRGLVLGRYGTEGDAWKCGGSTSASLTKARFALERLGLKNVTYEECNIEDSGGEIGPHDLCLGLLYHLENAGAEPAQHQQHHRGRYASSKPQWSMKVLLKRAQTADLLADIQQFRLSC